MEPFEENVSVINEDCVQKTQLNMANHHFPGFQITGLCDNLLLITFFSSFQKLHRSLGNIKDFQHLWQNQYSSRIHCSETSSNLSTVHEKCLNPAARLESLCRSVQHKPPRSRPKLPRFRAAVGPEATWQTHPSHNQHPCRSCHPRGSNPYS